MTLAAFFPLVDFYLIDADAIVGRLNAFSWQYGSNDEWQNITTLYSLGIAIVVTALLNLTIIFLFSKRKLQVKLTHYAFILKIAIIAVLVYFVCIMQGDDVASTKPQLGCLFVVLAMVFDWLAVKAIRKDEALVRSIDRIR